MSKIFIKATDNNGRYFLTPLSQYMEFKFIDISKLPEFKNKRLKFIFGMEG